MSVVQDFDCKKENTEALIEAERNSPHVAALSAILSNDIPRLENQHQVGFWYCHRLIRNSSTHHHYTKQHGGNTQAYDVTTILHILVQSPCLCTRNGTNPLRICTVKLQAVVERICQGRQLKTFAKKVRCPPMPMSRKWNVRSFDFPTG